MMKFEDLLAQRRHSQFKKMSRYAKYIFNDHFVIVMVFLLGALAFQYSEMLKTLPTDFFWGKVGVAFLLTLTIFFGKLSSLVEKADQVFLSSMEKSWQQHFKKVKEKSVLLPAFILFLLIGISMPLLFIRKRFGVADFLPIFITALLLKWIELSIQELQTRIHTEKISRFLHTSLAIAAFVLFMISFILNPWIGVILSFLLMVMEEKWFQRKASEQFPIIAWEKVIQIEEQRIAKMNGLINLFTDAPHTKSHAKRRKYLDPIVTKISGEKNSYQYLYTRSFLRGNSYSGLFIRLVMLGFIILSFTSIPVVSILLGVLFLYLTGFQLIPLYFQLDENIMVHLYPQAKENKFIGFKNLLGYLLIFESVLFVIAASIGAGLQVGILSLLINFLFTFLFSRFYVDKRTEKRDRKAF